MPSYVGNATYFCCYDDNCWCDDCCCQDTNCSTPCNNNIATCGNGGCCTCRTWSWGFAWKNPSCTWCCNYSLYASISCGSCVQLYDPNGNKKGEPPRVDTGPVPCDVMIDLTKPAFMSMAPLSQGKIFNVSVNTNCPCPGCPQ